MRAMMKEINEFIESYFDDTKDVSVSMVPFGSEVRKLCEQNMCGKYGKSWTCPPAVDSFDELQKKVSPFDRFQIVYKVYPLEDSFDWEGMMDAAKNFQKGIFKLKRTIKKTAPDFDCIVLGAGSCAICETCTYEDNEPCRHPEDAVTSVEAFGIDAMKMMQDNGLKYNNGANTVTYIGGIFYQSEN